MGELHLASVVGKEVVKEHARWRGPDLRARRGATNAYASEGVDAAISAWNAEKWKRGVRQILPEEKGKSHGGPASAAKKRKLNYWKKFKIPHELRSGSPSKSIVEARWALTRTGGW